MCLFSKEIRSPCSSFTSSRLHRNLDDSVTSRSRVVCQEVLKMIFISSNIELQIYGLKLVSLRTYECTGSTQSVGELTGSVRLSPVATIPRLTVATAPPLTVDAELTRSGRLSSTASPSPPTETTSPPWVYRLPYLERVTKLRESISHGNLTVPMGLNLHHLMLSAHHPMLTHALSSSLSLLTRPLCHQAPLFSESPLR
ncbi:BnaA02g10940D [Brassica napus]|uniref:BnaA02g10940D protein n=1 Tax=Brassica napus TaxID=3708 RepID=A0A078GPE6_BRANA|nr:BnaA02g10940D [Brassica napus]